jgi:hypothetical protein
MWDMLGEGGEYQTMKNKESQRKHNKRPESQVASVRTHLEKTNTVLLVWGLFVQRHPFHLPLIEGWIGRIVLIVVSTTVQEKTIDRSGSFLPKCLVVEDYACRQCHNKAKGRSDGAGTGML